MIKAAALERADLIKILLLSAILSALTVAVSFFIDSGWAIRFAAVAVLATLNWYALISIIRGFTEKRPVDIITGFMIKPLLLTLLLVLGQQGLIEVTSFLAGLNMFFVTLVGYLAARALFVRRSIPPQGIPSGSAGVNG